MNRFAHMVTHYKKTIIAVFLIITLICGLLALMVRINYNMVDYLPPEAQSTIALKIMTEEFDTAIPNASVMVRQVTLQQALDYKRQLQELANVTNVMWLDDVLDVKQPLEMADKAMVEAFYKDGNALYTVTVARGAEVKTTTAIRELIGEEGALTGEAFNLAIMQLALESEVTRAMIILLPIIILLLVLASTSWFEPLLYLIAIGLSIVINMGTNIFVGEISFMTNAVSPILQLAVSIDYAIFLLHSFAAHRQSTDDVVEAMKRAVRDSMSIVAASAAAAMFGFVALMFMDFRIGVDLGLVLAKGILFSFITVMVFLPPLTLVLFKFIDKTKHRPFMPSFKNVNRVLSRLAIPVLVVVILLVVPSFLGQNRTSYLYGNASVAKQQGYRDAEYIEETFGSSTIMMLLVPRGDVAREKLLSESLLELDHVTGLVSYPNQVGTAIPVEFLSDDIVSQFYSENFARIIVYTDTPEEGDLAFTTVEHITEIAQSYYGKEVWSAGQSASLYDMRHVVEKDKLTIDLIAIAFIFIILLVAFKSLSLPIILILAIQAAIWINLAIPYFSDTPINFIGFLVLSTVQLAATVDYAILLSINYVRNRRKMPQKEAIHTAMGMSFRPILVSAVILSVAGFTLFATSTNSAISDIGILLGRGALLAFMMVMCFLPALFKVFDKPIAISTWRSGFLFNKKPRLKERSINVD